MIPLTAERLRGNWATLLLPVQSDDRIDIALLAEELEQFVTARVSGVYSNGSAGEFYTQSEEEFDRIQALVAERCERAGLAFQIGLSHTSAQGALDRLRRTRALAPAAYQVTLPDWFPPTFPEVVAFFDRMAFEAGTIPLVVYNPPHAKRRLTPPEWIELMARVPGIIGAKVAGGDDAWYEAMRPVLASRSIFIPGHRLADGLQRGARGAYSNVACLSPAGAQRWYEQCLQAPDEGRALGRRILAFWESAVAPVITVDGLSNMAADKAAAVAGGWLPGLTPRLRWPYRWASPERVQSIGERARREVPELFG